MKTKEKGEVSEAMALGRLLQLGEKVLIPFGDSMRYDLAVDKGNGKIERYQIKTGHRRNGVLIFNTTSKNSKGKNKNKSREYTKEDIDAFVVYDPFDGNLYKINVNETSKSHMSLRVNLTANGQTKGIKWARDYRI